MSDAPSLYTRLGGYDAIAAVADNLLPRLQGDELLGRFWAHRGAQDNHDKMAAFATLYEVLTTFSLVAAPILPFITEEIYQGLVPPVSPDAAASVHHGDYPTADGSAIDVDLETAMDSVRTVVTLGRGLRKREELRVRQPLPSVTIVTRSQTQQAAIESHRDLIAEELNVKIIDVHADEAGLVDLSAKANFKVLGPRFGAETKAVASEIASLSHEQISSLMDGETVHAGDHAITAGDIVVNRSPREGTVVASEGSLSVALDCALTEDLRVEGVARELINRVQGLRRELNLSVTDRIAVAWASSDDIVGDAFDAFSDQIAAEVLATEISMDETIDTAHIDLGSTSVQLDVRANRAS
jgi:isoleucyl-tRNA synthetase